MSAALTKYSTGQLQELSKAQARRLFNQQAKHYLHMTGKEFIKKWDAGLFNGRTDSPAVIRVAMLLPFGR